ncbi:MAG: hypothetical protein IIA17_04250 [candidate division Zixibacteria bacterium]|nr:hypothetical protein [candidate division Zixibacteria bacterium]
MKVIKNMLAIIGLITVITFMGFAIVMINSDGTPGANALGGAKPPDAKTTTINEMKPQKDFEIVAISYRVTERHSVYLKYAWQLILENRTNRPKSFDAKIKFLDDSGFIIVQDDEYGLFLSAGAKETFTGTRLIEFPQAEHVESIIAEVKPK